MISFDTAHSWLDRKDESKNIDLVRVFEKLEDAYLNKEISKVRLYVNILLEISHSIDINLSLNEKAIFCLVISLYEFSLRNFDEAEHLLIKGIQLYYPDVTRNLGIAQWLLGCVLWEKSEQKLAIQAWQRSISYFHILVNKDDEKATFYEQAIILMENSLLEVIEAKHSISEQIRAKIEDVQNTPTGLQ